MTRDQFFDWAQAQKERYEFDGFQPVAMTGGTANHNRICQNVWFALRTRLSGTGCEPFGPNAGVATVGDAVRYPDALMTCAKFAGSSLLVPGVVAVFEVISPTSGRADRIDKMLEYRGVPSIRRYVTLEHLGHRPHSLFTEWRPRRLDRHRTDRRSHLGYAGTRHRRARPGVV